MKAAITCRVVALSLALIALVGSSAFAVEKPSTRRVEPDNGWDSRWFDYDPSKPIIASETTPTDEQLDFWKRPPQMAAVSVRAGEVNQAAARAMGDVEFLHLRFRDTQGEDVPVLLCKPRGKAGPFPVVIAIHGVGSNKAQICGAWMREMARHGFAMIALDLPVHGERPGDPADFLKAPDFAKIFALCRQAVVDVRMCIDVAEGRKDLDTRRGVALAGYSLGALVSSVAGPVDERVKVLVLVAGGTPELPAVYSLLPGLRAVQPQLSIPHFAGRALLMLNGTRDQAITRDMGERLFAAAEQPKEQKWFECGHDLPEEATEAAAAWIERAWKELKQTK